MKITMYELYGKIYDENPPRHIKVYDEDWYWNDYDGYVTKESLKRSPDAQIYLMDRYRTFMNLDKEVEIEVIEENKKIEHCLKSDRFLCDKAEMEHLRTKIDELIDEVNKLKGEN